MTRWEARDRTIRAAGDPIPGVMGIVNITPDSFSDGGRSLSAAAAAEHARGLIQQGADLLDLGAESTRPGSDPVPLEEELRRLLPVLEHLGSEIAVPLSIDTSKARVAELALARGASIINDVTALRGDPDMVRVVADSGAAVVLMHMLGTPRIMQDDPRYDDVVSDVLRLPRRSHRLVRVARHPTVADRHRSGDRLRQDIRAQPATLAELEAICQPGLYAAGWYLAQGAAGNIDRPGRV